jgi:hypothetical protein
VELRELLRELLLREEAFLVRVVDFVERTGLRLDFAEAFRAGFERAGDVEGVRFEVVPFAARALTIATNFARAASCAGLGCFFAIARFYRKFEILSTADHYALIGPVGLDILCPMSSRHSLWRQKVLAHSAGEKSATASGEPAKRSEQLGRA